MKKFLMAALFLACSLGLTRADEEPAEGVYVSAAQAILNADGSYTIQAVVYGWGIESIEYTCNLNSEAVGGPVPVNATQGKSSSWQFPVPYYGGWEAMAFEQTFAKNSGVAQWVNTWGYVEVQPHLVSIDRAKGVYRPTVSGEPYQGPVAKAGGGDQ